MSNFENLAPATGFFVHQDSNIWLLLAWQTVCIIK